MNADNAYPMIDCAEPHGRYGFCGEDASLGEVNNPNAKPIVRMPGRQDAERLARLIHETGCTVAEYSSCRKECRIIYGTRDDIVTATRLLEIQGYQVVWVQRHSCK
jgi:hypothetical protein